MDIEKLLFHGYAVHCFVTKAVQVAADNDDDNENEHELGIVCFVLNFCQMMKKLKNLKNENNFICSLQKILLKLFTPIN